MIRARSIAQFDRLPPARKLVTMIVAMAGRDLATSLRFDFYPETRIDVWYFVGGVPYELVPPPCSMWPFIVSELHRHMAYTRPDRPPWWQRFRNPDAVPQSPVGGQLALQLGDTTAKPSILLFRGRMGQHIEIETTDPGLRIGSRWFYGEWARLRRNELLIEFPDPGRQV